jgi:hypothetical protein
VKVDPNKLNDVIAGTTSGHHRNHPATNEETAPQSQDNVELAAASSQSWDGICLFLQEEPQAATQP